jgi:hypothetical protein
MCRRGRTELADSPLADPENTEHQITSPSQLSRQPAGRVTAGADTAKSQKKPARPGKRKERSAKHDAHLAATNKRQCNRDKMHGVKWDTRDQRWQVRVGAGPGSYVGRFDDAIVAMKAFDAVARKQRGALAHGGRGHNKQAKAMRWMLNFPTKAEQQALESRERREADQLEVTDARRAATNGRCGCTSAYRGVSWDNLWDHWTVQDVKERFDDEIEAAKAYDNNMREKYRPDQAHGMRLSNNTHMWLNFPTAKENAAADAQCAASAKAAQDAARAKSANAPWLKYSFYHGVGKCDLPSCVATGKVWKAAFKGKWLGAYVIEKDAALAHDAAIRALRNSDPAIWRKGTLVHGSRTRYQPWVMRLNFPTTAEKKRQQKYEQACDAEQQADRVRASKRYFGRTLEERNSAMGAPDPQLYAGTFAQQVSAARIVRKMMPAQFEAAKNFREQQKDMRRSQQKKRNETRTKQS